MRRLLWMGVVLGLPLASALAGTLIDIQVGDDAQATFLAVSASGNATATGKPFRVPGIPSCCDVPGAAASGTGNSQGDLAMSGTGDAAGYGLLAISGTGDADGFYALSLTGACNGRPCFAVEPTGDARASDLGVSGTGRSEGLVAVSGLGSSKAAFLAVGGSQAACSFDPCAAVGGAGESDATAAAISGTGDAACHLDDCEAFTATGNATCESYNTCRVVSLTGNASIRPPPSHYQFPSCNNSLIPCAAVSGTGNADAGCSFATCVATSGTGNASGECEQSRYCIAVSGTGHARSSGTAVSACDTLLSEGFAQACTR